MKTVSLCITLLLIASLSWAAHTHPERYYQDQVCSTFEGVAEHRLPCAARVDCLTADHAIEFDFATKWAEAIGQALYYSSQTGKRAGVVLIKEKETDQRYVDRVMKTIAAHGLQVDVWVVRGD